MRGVPSSTIEGGIDDMVRVDRLGVDGETSVVCEVSSALEVRHLGRETGVVLEIFLLDLDARARRLRSPLPGLRDRSRLGNLARFCARGGSSTTVLERPYADSSDHIQWCGHLEGDSRQSICV